MFVDHIPGVSCASLRNTVLSMPKEAQIPGYKEKRQFFEESEREIMAMTAVMGKAR